MDFRETMESHLTWLRASRAEWLVAAEQDQGARHQKLCWQQVQAFDAMIERAEGLLHGQVR
jgi:hypothetical protein